MYLPGSISRADLIHHGQSPYQIGVPLMGSEGAESLRVIVFGSVFMPEL
jgi:hypothetical protein